MSQQTEALAELKIILNEGEGFNDAPYKRLNIEALVTRLTEAQKLPQVDADIQALRERVSVCIADVACNGESVVTLTHHIDNLVTASAERIKELEKEVDKAKTYNTSWNQRVSF